MTSEDLARRFMHVNLNCDTLARTEELYSGALGMAARMRTDPTVPTDGTILGLDSETYCETAFLYDSRGPRDSCSLEAIEYRTPPLVRDDSADPVRPGIRSTLMTVADLDAAVDALGKGGYSVGNPVEGLISITKSVLVVDRDGVVIELTQRPVQNATSDSALFAGIRIAAINAHATAEFLTAIGFEETEAPTRRQISGVQLAPGGSADSEECIVARFALPEDAHQFTVVVVQHPHTKPHPVPWGGNRQGLYRCALRVENVAKSVSMLPSSVERQGDRVWCPLPGTQIDGLYIAFLRSPDGVVFEFVERPLELFAS